jgi:hypothetical protein
MEKPRAMNMSSASTLRVASTLPMTRPGPTPRRCTHDISRIADSATRDCRENTSGIHGKGIVKSGAGSPAPGMNRSR